MLRSNLGLFLNLIRFLWFYQVMNVLISISNFIFVWIHFITLSSILFYNRCRSVFSWSLKPSRFFVCLFWSGIQNLWSLNYQTFTDVYSWWDSQWLYLIIIIKTTFVYLIKFLNGFQLFIRLDQFEGLKLWVHWNIFQI
jgi:hypothetical protein